MRFIVAVAAALLLFLGSLPRAEAAPITYREWSNICSTGPLTTFASVKLGTEGTLATLQIKNLSGLFGSYENFVITGISFFNLGSAEIPDVVQGPVSTMTGPKRTANADNPPPSWTVSNISGSGGVLGLDFTAGGARKEGAAPSSRAASLPGGSTGP